MAKRGTNVTEGLRRCLGKRQERPGKPSLPSLALWRISRNLWLTLELCGEIFFFSQFGLDPDVPFCTHSCHPMHGECSCQSGWAGLHCNESCPQDTHGPGCQEHCLCLHGGLCLADSGLCRCAPGYTVRLCSTAGKELGR